MKIVHKVIAANLFNIVLIALIGLFSYQNVNLVLTKLHFVEIADDLNAAFLEARISEKNYFLYNDRQALDEIEDNLRHSLKTIELAKEDIVRATSGKKFSHLKSSLESYQEAIELTKTHDPVGNLMSIKVREAGRQLREYSQQITRLERKEVNQIITRSRQGLFYSLCIIVFSAVSVSYLLFFKILASLKKIEQVAHSISEGNFSKVESGITQDELGAALMAINSMSEELKNREEQIIQSKKLASIGILTAGIAHELGNPLNNISMLAQTGQYLSEQLNRAERTDYLKQIEEETERIQEIVKNLLDFSKPRKADLVQSDINAVVHKSVKLVHNMVVVNNLDLELNLTVGLPPVFIDQNQIQEVLINLISNAVQACSPGDHLTVGTHLGADASLIEVEVSDTGKGIPPHLIPHLFDPFFSSKGAGGTGLGLSITYGIVKNHHGDIKIHSQVGSGTTFVVELPIYQGEEKAKHERS